MDAGRAGASWARRQVRPGDRRAARAGAAWSDARVRSRRCRTLSPTASTPGPAAAVVAAADRVLAGTWTVLGVVRPDSADPDWFLDPRHRAAARRTGVRVPRSTTGTRPRPGNVKQVWELSRHHHLTVLAAA